VRGGSRFGLRFAPLRIVPQPSGRRQQCGCTGRREPKAAGPSGACNSPAGNEAGGLRIPKAAGRSGSKKLSESQP